MGDPSEVAVDEQFSRLQSQLQARHYKKAYKTCEEGELKEKSCVQFWQL